MAEENTQERKAELDEANQLKDEVMQGLQVGEPAERLLLKAIHALALIDNDSVSYNEAKSTMIAIYGDTLGQEVPLQIELEAFTKRLATIKAFYEKAKAEESEEPDTLSRALNAIRAHERRIAYLKERISKLKK
ncbi:MAG: hypothetical protein LKE53_04455 [Oscillospiraceae bacterium]|nr:hypothetical protein [Oscillospiraceae bacterium]MDD3260871.1 hypothetical protein [Oscillospiraceae bacterium]